MYYYSTVYKYKKDEILSNKYLFNNESETPLSETEIEKLISDLLIRKGIEFDSIVILLFESVDKEKYNRLQAGVGVDMDEQGKKAN